MEKKQPKTSGSAEQPKKEQPIQSGKLERFSESAIVLKIDHELDCESLLTPQEKAADEKASAASNIANQETKQPEDQP